MNLADFLKSNFFSKALVRNNGIARRIMLAVILFSSAVTAVITAVELYLDYRVDIAGIHERVDSIRKVYLPTLVESVWMMESNQMQNHLNGLLNLGDVEYLSIEFEGKVLCTVAGARTSQRQMETVFPSNYIAAGEHIAIGELHVVASVDNVVSRLVVRIHRHAREQCHQDFFGHGLCVADLPGFGGTASGTYCRLFASIFQRMYLTIGHCDLTARKLGGGAPMRSTT